MLDFGRLAGCTNAAISAASSPVVMRPGEAQMCLPPSVALCILRIRTPMQTETAHPHAGAQDHVSTQAPGPGSALGPASASEPADGTVVRRVDAPLRSLSSEAARPRIWLRKRRAPLRVRAQGSGSGPTTVVAVVQELLGHDDVRTTMIYTQVLNRGGKGVHNPADVLL